MNANKKLEAFYKKAWPDKRRPLDIAYVNFVVSEFGKGSLLDVGCGFGELIGVLREFGFKVKGTAASKYEVDECKRKGLNVLFHDASNELPYNNESFNFVLSIGSIEHIKGWQTALNEMHRVLTHGGKLLIETPNHPVFRKSKKFKEAKEDFDFVHLKEFGFDELRQELEKVGFKDIKAHDKWFYYPNHFVFKPLHKIKPKKSLPYLFFSAVKK